MAKKILQDIHVRGSRGESEYVTRITRKEYYRPEQEEPREILESNPIDDIEIPGEIDIDMAGVDEESSFESSETVPVRSRVVDFDEDTDTNDEAPSLRPRRIASDMKVRSSRESNPLSALPVVHTRLSQPQIPDTTPEVSRVLQFSFRPLIPNIPRKTLFIIGGSIIALVFLVWLLSFFEKAHVTIQAKEKELNLVGTTFTATKNTNAPISFEIMVFSDEEKKDMTLLDSMDVSIKAKGEVTLYNEYSSKPLKITAGTFIADASGKAYTLDSTVTIPGFTLNKTTVIPGQITVRATSFLPGDAYNTTSNTFTFTSFKKDTVKFKKVYARLKTAFAGGAQGLVYVATDRDKAMLQAYALSTFKNSLVKKVQAQVPKGYILYPNASSFVHTIDSEITSKTPQAKIAIKGTLSAVLLREVDLSRALIGKVLPKASPSEINQIYLDNIELLSFDFVPSGQLISKTLQTVSFKLSGSVHAEWQPKTSEILTGLLGADKDSVSHIFAKDPGVGSAHVTIFPPWQSRIPNEASRIVITTE